MQCQADVSGVPVERPKVHDAAALGAAYLAGIATGLWSSAEDAGKTWRRDRSFEPRWSPDERGERNARWKSIVQLARRQP
jgi:glycerol kinase